MSYSVPIVCNSCEQLMTFPNTLSRILAKNHRCCALIFIQFSYVEDSLDWEWIAALDDVVVFLADVFATNENGLFSSSICIWKAAIARNCFNIMEYFAYTVQYWDTDVEYAATIGNICSLKYLIENLNRPVTRQSLIMASRNGHLEVLKHLHFLCTHDPILKLLSIWDKDVVIAAVSNGKLECLKYILEDRSVYHPFAMAWAAIDGGPSLNEDVLECFRYAYDNGFLWSHYLCPILFDNCAVIRCRSCPKTNYNSFNEYRTILQSIFNRQYGHIVSLMVSFAAKYERCHHCGKLESHDGPDFKHCDRCLTTYYCGEECQLKNWHQSHKTTCGTWSNSH